MNVLKLKEFRKNMSLSQREVAELMKITQAYYWLWETGKSFPNAKQIMELCEIFKCTPNDLFGFKGQYVVAIETLDTSNG